MDWFVFCHTSNGKHWKWGHRVQLCFDLPRLVQSRQEHVTSAAPRVHVKMTTLGTTLSTTLVRKHRKRLIVQAWNLFTIGWAISTVSPCSLVSNPPPPRSGTQILHYWWVSSAHVNGAFDCLQRHATHFYARHVRRMVNMPPRSSPKWVTAR